MPNRGGDLRSRVPAAGLVGGGESFGQTRLRLVVKFCSSSFFWSAAVANGSGLVDDAVVEK
jgi:hypothetical protein